MDSTRLKTPVDWPKGEVEFQESPRMFWACATEARADMKRVVVDLSMTVCSD